MPAEEARPATGPAYDHRFHALRVAQVQMRKGQMRGFQHIGLERKGAAPRKSAAHELIAIDDREGTAGGGDPGRGDQHRAR